LAGEVPIAGVAGAGLVEVGHAWVVPTFAAPPPIFREAIVNFITIFYYILVYCKIET
jgi:hypothetical protein